MLYNKTDFPEWMPLINRTTPTGLNVKLRSERSEIIAPGGTWSSKKKIQKSHNPVGALAFLSVVFMIDSVLHSIGKGYKWWATKIIKKIFDLLMITETDSTSQHGNKN
jgi:hypothetical protein